MEVVVVGSCMTDLISYVPKLPNPGETLHGTEFKVGFGGKGANQAVMAAKIGSRTAMVAKLGTDTFGDNYLQNLKDVGVDVSCVGRTEAAASGIATITVDSKAENVIVIVGGANNLLSCDDVTAARDVILSARVAVFQMEIPLQTNIAALELIKSESPDTFTIFNAAPATDFLPQTVYKLSDVFCVNESEAERLLNMEDIRTVEEGFKAVQAFIDRGCNVAMVTLGSKGVVYCDRSKKLEHVQCPSVLAVDTTGAGDSFIGTLAHLVAKKELEGISFYRKVEIACQVASESVTKTGTQSSYPCSYKIDDA